MQKRNWIVLLTGLILVGIFAFITKKTTDQEFLAIVDVTVIPMTKNLRLEHQTVLIEDGKISAIVKSKDFRAGENVRLIDGRGKFVIPGLFDMHTHFFYEQVNHVNTCEAELKLMLANGLTTARIQCGDSVYLVARKNVREKKWKGPKLFISSPQFVGAWPWPDQVFAMVCTTPDEAIMAVKTCKAQGYDEIKITFMVKRNVYDAIIRTAREENIKVTGHVGPLVKLPAALAAKQQIEHLDEFIDMLLPDTSYNHGESVSDMNIWRKRAWNTVPYLDESKIPDLVKRVKEAGIFVTPTNYFFFSSFAENVPKEISKQRPDFPYIPGKIASDRWRVRDLYWKNPPPEKDRARYIHLRKQITLQLSKAGVKLMAGSDSPEWFLVQGFSIHNELETFVSAGLSPYSALETATRNPAEYLGILAQKGTLEPGKDADMVILEKDPLKNISNTRSIFAVVQGGIYYNKEALSQMKEEAQSDLNPQVSTH